MVWTVTVMLGLTVVSAQNNTKSASKLGSDLVKQYIEASTQKAESELASWVPNNSVPVRVPRNLAVDRPRIDGDRVAEMVGSLTIHPKGHNTYAVQYRSSGCLAIWSFSRTAALAGSELILNRPVKEYCGDVFDRFVVLRCRGVDYLVPGPRADRFVSLISTSSPNRWYITGGVESLGYLRRSEFVRRRVENARWFEQAEATKRPVAPTVDIWE